jgi:APA family basic amino acid/polyamine antiporter
VLDCRSLLPPRAALERVIALPQAVAIVVGIIIGVSIFVQPAEVSRYVPSVPGIFAVWLAAGLLTLAGALVCAELSSAFPETGGVYIFLNKTISSSAGFLWAWAMFWIAHSGIIAATSVVFGRYVATFIPLDDTGVRIVAACGIALLSTVNYLGVRPGSGLQTAVTAAKILAILLILVFVLVLGRTAHAAIGAAPPANFSAADFALAVGAGLFAFGGWHMVTYSAGETRRPEKTIPRALIIGTLTVTGCYIALNAACLYLLPLDRVIHSTRVAADAAEVLLGPRGAAAISGIVMISAFGVLNGVILAGPRVYLAMAGQYRALAWMGAVHPRFHTPHVAILIQAAWSCVLVATGTYRELFSRVVYTEWIFFALMAFGLIRSRRRSGYQPPYRAPFFPTVPLLFIAASAGVVFSQVAADPWRASGGLLFVLLGLPVYYFWIRRTAA